MEKNIVRQPKQLWRIMFGFLLSMFLVWFAGCACSDGVPRAMEADYGHSYTNNRMEMMITPPDAVDPKPPVGMTPQAAANTQERYDKSFKEKPEPPTIRWLFQ
jgi:hypothetical protein